MCVCVSEIAKDIFIEPIIFCQIALQIFVASDVYKIIFL